MRVTALIRYAAEPGDVFAMLTDRDFQDRKLRATGATTWSVEVTPGASGGTTVRTTRELPTDEVPDAFRSLVGSSLTVVQTEEWGAPAADGSRSGKLTVQVPGAPLGVNGTVSLKPAAGGTEEVVEGDLKAKVPLIGGRIEKAAEPAIRMAIDVEERIGHAWLTEGH
ncbi:DUF2505 domain-containing protein [Spongisporangium articulatum]|uniref:DUF2505 domain-containing protein n=1 Tax=Spongisporangium articulatum TaxID=3362603 RepID=A0ABW8AKN1_9ACTN